MAEPTAAEPILSDAQVASYHEDGYLVLPDVLSAQELAALRAAADALDEERLRRGGAERTVAIHDVIFLQEAFMEAAHHPALVGASVQLIGENLHLLQARVHWKPIAKGEGAVDWHQDYPFLPLTNYDLLAVTSARRYDGAERGVAGYPRQPRARSAESPRRRRYFCGALHDSRRLRPGRCQRQPIRFGRPCRQHDYPPRKPAALHTPE